MRIELYNEDCLHTLTRQPTGSIDLLLQDTPFGVTKNDWDIKPNLPVMWEHWNRVTKENGAMIFFATQPFASELILSNAKNFRYDLIWYKALGTGFLNANRMPMRNHEHVLVFYRKMPVYNPQKYIGKMRAKGGRADRTGTNYGTTGENKTVNDSYFPQSILDFSNGDRTIENDHPTQKPLDLIRYLIKTYSNENETVFDGYAGSATTHVACILEKRNCIGAEIGFSYYENSMKRIEREQSKLVLF